MAYSNIRFEWINTAESSVDKNIVDTSSISFDQLKDYDRKCFPTDRTGFLKSWLKMPRSFSFTSEIGNAIKGYGVIRKCMVGYKIGPLFSENVEIAERLFLKLCSSVDKN